MKKTLNYVLLIAAVAAPMAPAKAQAGGPQEVIINMGLDFAKSIAGKYVMSQLFPENGIDYKQIRKDMEEVTRTVITDQTITEALGKINAAGINASTTLYRADAVDVLDSIRRDLVVNYAVTGTGMFRFAGLGNYVHGAQTELSILAAMSEQLALGKKGNCDLECTKKILKDRLTFQIKYVTNTRDEIKSTNIKDLMSKISACKVVDTDTQCGTHGCWVTARYWGFIDDGAGYRSPKFKSDEAGCQRSLESYKPSRKLTIEKDQDGKLGWLTDTVKTWQSALDLILK